ncbi:Na(+)/H(+) exchange regulatory cofactor NHE-RF3 [Amia ocellicauda]|uniref:Na(+)/H(+) exchange regulatory cofactor NHE-RF3 n=1 Tax=Amia ocellicauda TaxID=2972642 RepID=UPI003464649B
MELTQKFIFNPKEGIDNPALVITDDSEAEWKPVPRLCQMKREEGESFGFYLRVELGCHGHVIREVDPWSVAERSGLRDGDRLLEINDHYVHDLEHYQIVQKILASGTQVVFLVLEASEYERALDEGLNLRGLAQQHRGEKCAQPRLCHIPRSHSAGLGFTVSAVEGVKGKFYVSTTASGGPAEKAGVQPGDRLIWINGTMVSELTHSALSKMIKRCGDHVTVLVIDSVSEQIYTRRRLAILPAMAGTHNLPHRPRKLHLVQAPEGYGFLLRQERMPSGRIAHFLREIDPGSPAESAGMQDGDQLLAVNGHFVQELEHEDIVSRVRKSGSQVTLIAIHSQGNDYYTRLGLSPLLFFEDDPPKKEKDRAAPLPILASPPAGLPHEVQPGYPVPRLCQLKKGPNGFGFHLGCIQHEPGTYIGQVAPGGSAERAGLREGDVVVEVNRHNVEEEFFEGVVMRMREGGQVLSVLVLDRQGYEQLRQSRTPISASLALRTQVEKSPCDSFL